MTSTVFIDTGAQDQVIELAVYISSLRGDEEEALVKQITPLAESDKIVEAIKILAAESTTLLEAPEKEFEPAFNLLLATALLNGGESEIEGIVKTLTTETKTKTTLKFKVLSNLFNTVAADSPLRLSTFTSIVELAAASDDLDLVIPQLQYLPSWIQEWGLDTEAAQKLYLTLADRLQERGNTDESLECLLKYLSIAKESGSHKEQATRAIVESIKIEKVLNFENLLKIDAVQQLKDEKVYGLLSIFLSGNVQDYRAFVAKESGLVASLGLNEESNLRKIRLLSLASLGSEHLTRELKYEDIAKALEIDEEEVELWVIDVIRAGLVEAKLSQTSKTAVINRSIYRTFGEPQWKQLSGRLNGWKQSLAEILQVIANAKLATSASISTSVVASN